MRVSQLLATLRQTPHNGFPIVGCKLETMRHVSGLILRQQLEVILELRLWGNQSGKETPLADDVRLRYISAITMADTPMRIDPAYPTRRGSGLPTTVEVTGLVSAFGGKLRRLSCAASAASGTASGAAGSVAGGAAGDGPAAGGREHAVPVRRSSSVCFGAAKEMSEAGFSAEELNAFVDLRVFMDPAPHTISELAPMASVYHLFNLMGVRHLPVFDERQRLCGIITRKDMVLELIEAKLSESKEKAQGAARKLQLMRSAAAALKRKSFSPAAIHDSRNSQFDSRRRPSLGAFSASSIGASSFGRNVANSGGGGGGDGGGRGGRMLSVMRRLSSRQSLGSSDHGGGDNCVPLGSLPHGLPNMGLPQGPVLRRSNSAPILHRGEQLPCSERPSNLRGQSTAGPARSPPPLRSRRGSKSSNSGGEGARWMGSPLAARCSTMGNVPSPFLLRRGSNPSNPRSPPFSRRGSREPSQSPMEPNNNPRASPRCSAPPPLASRPSLLPLGMDDLPPLSTPPLQDLVTLGTLPDGGALARVARRPSCCQFVVPEGTATTGDGGAG